MNGFEDGRFVGDATVPLTKARSCADVDRANALYEFMLNFGLRADNTWFEWDCVTRVGWRHESRESQVDYLLSSEDLTFLDVWVDSSLVCDSDHLAVVGTYQTVRNVGVSGTGKKKRIPCALRWTANDPVAWEKSCWWLWRVWCRLARPVGFSWFPGAHCRCAQDTSKMREGSGYLRFEGTVAMCYDGCGAETLQSSLVAETKGSRSTETSGFSAGSMRGETISSATKAWQSLQLAESFWARTSVVGHQKFLRGHF